MMPICLYRPRTVSIHACAAVLEYLHHKLLRVKWRLIFHRVWIFRLRLNVLRSVLLERHQVTKEPFCFSPDDWSVALTAFCQVVLAFYSTSHFTFLIDDDGLWMRDEFRSHVLILNVPWVWNSRSHLGLVLELPFHKGIKSRTTFKSPNLRRHISNTKDTKQLLEILTPLFRFFHTTDCRK
jgi:hypothetical protein